MNKGKEYLDKLNIEYNIDYKGYPKKYYLSFELDEKALKEPEDELMREQVFKTNTPDSQEMSFEVKDDGTIIIYDGDKIVKQSKTNPEYAKKVFTDLNMKEVVREDIVKSIEPLDAEVAREVDFVFASDDQDFGYKMLGRLKSDNDYILGALKDYSEDGKVSLESINKFLWFHDIDKQIAFMKGIYERLNEKPEWISLEDIHNYEKELKDIIRVEESLKENLNTFDYDKLQKELEAIPNVTKVEFDKDLIYDTKELVVLVSWHSDNDTAQWFKDKVAVKTKAIEVFKNNSLKLSDPVEDNEDYYYFVLREITPKTESLKEELTQEEEKEYGLNTLVNQLIKSEYDAIDDYNSAIVTFEAEGQGEYTDVIRSIIEDERHHIGNLQEIMNRITPGTEAEFEHGKEEAIETLDEEKPEDEFKTTIDTEEGVIKTYKLDNTEEIERIKDVELEDSALQG